MFISSAQNLLLPVSLIGFCLGIWTGRNAPAGIDQGLLFLLALLISLLCWLALRAGRTGSKRLLLAIGFLFFIAGILRCPNQDLSPPSNNAYYLFPQQNKATFVAEVTRFPVIKGDIFQFEARLLDILTPEKRHPTSGLIRLSMPITTERLNLPPGQMFIARGTISRITSFKNPGGFDYRDFLAEHGIYLKGWIDSEASLQAIEPVPAAGLFRSLSLIPEKIRFSVYRYLNNTLAALPAALYSAILIGDRSSLSPKVAEDFKATGAMHLLAISGLHVGMLAFFCLLFFSFLFRRFPALLQRCSLWKLTAALTILPLLGYALIAGFQPPVVRSLLMFTVLTFAILADRWPDLPNSIMVAALFILAISPLSLFTVSFQLTFTAVLAIVLVTRHIYPGTRSHQAAPKAAEKFPFTRRFLLVVLLSLVCSTAAWIGTAPLILYHFNRISLISPLSSLLLGPLFCFIALPLGFAACLLLPIYQPLAHFLLQLGGQALIFSARICAFLSKLTFTDLYHPPPTLPQVLMGYGLLLALILWKRAKYYKWATEVLVVLLAGTTLLPRIVPATACTSTAAKVVFLDVGQGDAAILRLPGNKNFVIDGGSHQRIGVDVGRTIIAPYLLRQNIQRLEGIVLTHPHADHFNGLLFLLKKFHPKKLWVNTAESNNAEYRELLLTARRVHTEICLPKGVDVLQEIGEYRLSAANMTAMLTRAGQKAPHGPLVNDGLVVKLSGPEEAILLPGDIGSESERFLAAALPSYVKANVLLASHHGSLGSNSRDFLAAVKPECIVISALQLEQDQPRRILSRTDPHKPPLMLTTAQDGAVTVTLARRCITVSTEEKGGFGRQAGKSWELAL